MEEVKEAKHVIDVILNYQGPVDSVTIGATMRKNEYGKLPAPFKPKGSCESMAYTMRLQWVPNGQPGCFRIFKYFHFEEKQLRSAIQEHFIVGDALTVSWGQTADKSRPMKVFLYMFDRLGGSGFKYHESAVEVKKESIAADLDKKRAGYQYIRDWIAAHPGNNHGEFME